MMKSLLYSIIGLFRRRRDSGTTAWSKGVAIINMRVYREATDSWEDLPTQVSTFQGRLR